MDTRRNITVISDVYIPGVISTGGARRSMRSIIEYSKYFDVDLIIPRALNISESKLNELISVLNVKEAQCLSVRSRVIALLHERYSALFYVSFPILYISYLSE